MPPSGDVVPLAREATAIGRSAHGLARAMHLATAREHLIERGINARRQVQCEIWDVG